MVDEETATALQGKDAPQIDSSSTMDVPMTPCIAKRKTNEKMDGIKDA